MPALSIANLAAWIVQATTVVIAAGAVARVAGLQPASLRFAWWRAVLVLCLLLPWIQPWQDVAPPLAAALIHNAALPRVAEPSHGAPAAMPRVLALGLSGKDDSTLLGLALLLGTGLRLAWLAAGLFRLRHLRRAGRPAAIDDFCPELQTLTDGDVDIRYVDSVGQPVTFGLRRPVVLLPSLLREQPVLVQRAVLAHELLHVRRRDWAWVVCEETLRAALWFQPAIWWVISRVQASREEVVDASTVRLTGARRSYIEALLVFAQEPPLFPAAPFARRRHLLTRMLLISQEAVMSSRRILASCAAMLAILMLAGWSGAAAFPLTAAPAAGDSRAQSPQARDPRPGEVRPATAREIQLQKMIAAGTAGADTFVAVARLQEERKAIAAAEATLLALRTAQPGQARPYTELAAHYRRLGQFDKAGAVLEEMAAVGAAPPPPPPPPPPPGGQEMTSLNGTPLVRVGGGIAQPMKIYDVRPTYPPIAQAANVVGLVILEVVIDEAGSVASARVRRSIPMLDDAALEAVRQWRYTPTLLNGVPVSLLMTVTVNFTLSGTEGVASMVQPPAPSGFAPDAPALVSGRIPVRIGGGINPPAKVRDVRPVYPDVARAAGVSGVVILELVLDEAGSVLDARILRSIPLLDAAALDAVRQWRYATTVVNGEAVPAILTVTVNFTLS